MPRRMPVPTGPDLCEPVGSSTRVSYFPMRSAFREAVSLLEIRSLKERHQRRASPKPIFRSRRPSVTCELEALNVTGIIVRQRMRRRVIGRVLKPGTEDISQGRVRCRGCVLGPSFFLFCPAGTYEHSLTPSTYLAVNALTWLRILYVNMSKIMTYSFKGMSTALRE